MYLFILYNCFCTFADISEYGIETPVRVGELAHALQGFGDASFIINGFTNGFSLGISHDYKLKYEKLKRRPSPAPLLAKLREEVAKGRIIGPFQTRPINDLFISPLYVIPKPNSHKHRMIFNLSYPESGSINDNIPDTCRSVRYCSVRDVGQCLLAKYGERAWLAKIDLADAYRIVPVQQADWKFLGMCINDQFYIDRMLPMGAASSCQIFSRFSDSLRWIFYNCGLVRTDLFNYLDDFLVVADSQRNCENALATFVGLCESMGVPIATHKTVYPAKALVFLGIGIDATHLAMYIPDDKKQVMHDKLNQFLSQKAPRVKVWQSIAGSLNHIAQVLVCGRIYMSSIYESLSGILSQQQSKRRKISTEVKEDLRVWLILLDLGPSRPFKMFDSSLSACSSIYTDASTTVGYGCVWGLAWFSGCWPAGKKCNIAVLELYPIYIALAILVEQFSNTAVNVYTDNIALVSVLNRLYCKDQSLRRIMREIVQLCLKNNIHIIARHISGERNVGPDLLSRGMSKKFLLNFPHMNGSPTYIPENLKPENNQLIQWIETPR